MAPVYLGAPGGMFGKLLTIRFVSIVAGCGVVLLTFAISHELFPDELGVRTGAVAFVALQPQFSFEAAIVNHDILVILLATLAVWLAIVWARDELTFARSLWLGLTIGAGMLTKVSFGLMIPVLLCAIWRFGRGRGASWREVGTAAVLACGTGLLIASPWFIRSAWLYGDPTGARELRTIPNYGSQAQPVLEMLGSASFWQGRLEDFWGNYGWRLIPFDPGTYHAVYWAWFVAGAGLAVALIAQGVFALRGRCWPFTRFQLDGLLVMAVWTIMMIAGVLYVGTIQFTQSRFAFPGMAAFGMLTAAGLAAPLPARVRWLVGPVVLLAMLVLNVTTTIRFLIPFYAGRGGLPGMLP
jgi:4-amino-4-deoxy-L-arabinose transferase-like glycosyltransferase